MKNTNLRAGALRVFLALQICFLALNPGQAQEPGGDSLVASIPRLLSNEMGDLYETSQQWEQVRRPDIMELFRKHVYGRVPESDVRVDFMLIHENRKALNGMAIMKEIRMEVSNGDSTLTADILIFLPVDQNGPVPLFLGMNFGGNHTVHPDAQIGITDSWVMNSQAAGITDNRASKSSRGGAAGRWPVELILSRGYGLATMYYGDIDPDFHDSFENGIHGLMDPSDTERAPDSWGSIAAWAWGLSRAMDYFEKDEAIDHHRVALMGHSRLGKTSLWAGAQDERFALVISNDSGCGGAALSRRPFGERVSNINSFFPHWFASRFHGYNDNEGALPVDQHMLLALVAPRPIYVASAREDAWADPRGEYLSLVYAGEVYRLYDSKISFSETMPHVDQPVLVGNMGYHMRSGVHDVTRYDWEQYLDFADAHMQ